jgi:hypothetical protein
MPAQPAVVVDPEALPAAAGGACGRQWSWMALEVVTSSMFMASAVVPSSTALRRTVSPVFTLPMPSRPALTRVFSVTA